MTSHKPPSGLGFGAPLTADMYRPLSILLGVLATGATLITLALIFLTVESFNWQYAILTGAYAFTSLAGFHGVNRCAKHNYSLLWVVLPTNSLVISLILVSTLISSAALPAAILFLIFSLLEATVTFTGLRLGSFTIVMGLIFSTLIALAGTYFNDYQIDLEGFNLIIPGLLGLTALVFLVILVQKLSEAHLQLRLTTAFLAILIIPLTITSIIQNQASLNRIRNETYSGLSATSSQVALVLDKFINNNLESTRQEADLDALSIYLSDVQGSPPDVERNMKIVMNLLLTRETDERKALSSYGLIALTGANVFDTDKNEMGKMEDGFEYFRQPLLTGRPYASSVVFDGKGNGFIYFSAPIKSVDRTRIVGVLRAKYSASVFQRIAVSYSGLYGNNSHVVIIDDNMLRIADSYKPALAYKAIDDLNSQQIEQMQAQKRLPLIGQNPAAFTAPELVRLFRSSSSEGSISFEFETVDEEESHIPEVIAYATMNTLPWKVIYLKADYDQRPIENQQSRTVILITSIAALVIGLISIEASRVLAAPIINLTRTAQQISSGDLNVRAEHTGTDEIGTLATAFNRMTDQLQSFIHELENRVTERTLELERRNQILEYRSNQLQTVSEVARGIVTSQELLPLLDSVTLLISSRFGFYHVGIFLLDETREFAVLRAANSEGGKRMLTRNHMLKVGKVGIVGYVTGTGQPRITTDVGEDAVFYNNPDLPLTRSEMALPLRIGSEIIGALDVQSTASDAFTRNDIELFSTLADQVAVAIFNNRLYNETARALSESQAVHRQYLRQEWTTEIATRRNNAYRYTPQGVGPDDAALFEDETLTTGKPESIAELQPDGTTRVELVVPIYMRGEMIGAIRVRDQGEDRVWSEDERLAVNDVASQVGVALETARLFEKTTLRAERERKVLEITGRIRAANDPQKMLEIAAAELQKALGVTRAQISVRPVANQTADQPHAKPNGAHPSQDK